jgi:hypothetical protein
MTTNPEIDARLDDIALRQFVWKNQKLLTACLLIAHKALKDSIFWPDELVFDFLLTPEDRNVIGSAWRMCSRSLKIIEKTGQYRRSKGDDRNGGMIFCYRLLSRHVAEAFLKRYDLERYRALTHPQLDLFK